MALERYNLIHVMAKTVAHSTVGLMVIPKNVQCRNIFLIEWYYLVENRLNTISPTHTHGEIAQFPPRQLSGTRNHVTKGHMVPSPPMVAELGIMCFLSGYMGP